MAEPVLGQHPEPFVLLPIGRLSNDEQGLAGIVWRRGEEEGHGEMVRDDERGLLGKTRDRSSPSAVLQRGERIVSGKSVLACRPSAPITW